MYDFGQWEETGECGGNLTAMKISLNAAKTIAQDWTEDPEAAMLSTAASLAYYAIYSNYATLTTSNSLNNVAQH